MADDRTLSRAKLYSDEQSVIQDALRYLLQARPVLRLEMAIYRYQTGAISLGKAANLAGVSFEQMREMLSNRGIELHLGPETQEEAKAELTTLRSPLECSRVIDNTVLSNFCRIGRLEFLIRLCLTRST